MRATTRTRGRIFARASIRCHGRLRWSLPWCAFLGGLLRAPGPYMVYSLGGVRPLPAQATAVPGWLRSSMGVEESVALLAARTRSHEPSRCQSILLVMLLDARSSPAARARRNRSAQWHQRTSAQTLSATTRWLPHVDVTSNIERRTTLARGTKPVPTAEATAMQRCSCSCSRQQLQHLAAAVAMDGAPPWKAPGCEGIVSVL